MGILDMQIIMALNTLLEDLFMQIQKSFSRRRWQKSFQEGVNRLKLNFVFPRGANDDFLGSVVKLENILQVFNGEYKKIPQARRGQLPPLPPPLPTPMLLPWYVLE